MKRLRMGIMVMCMILLFGCGNNNKQEDKDNIETTSSVEITDSNVAEILKTKLEEKYETELIMGEVQKQKSDTLFDSNPSYYALVSLKENANLKFDAQIFVNSGDVLDNYSKLIFGEAIENKIASILERHPLIVEVEHNMIYTFSEGKWLLPEQQIDFLKESGSFVSISMAFEPIDTETMVDEIYLLMTELEEEGFYSKIKVSFNGKNINIYHMPEDAKLTKEAIKNKFK